MEVAILQVNESSSARTSIDRDDDISEPRSLDIALENNHMPESLAFKKPERIIDYELDHHIISSSRCVKEYVSDSNANMISLDHIDIKAIKANTLTPREQEKTGRNKGKEKGSLLLVDQSIQEAIHCLFNNQFMKAKKIFEQQASQ